MSQTTIGMQDTLPVAPGTLHGLSSHNRVRSLVNQESSAEIPFGVAVVQGTIDDGAKLPDGTGDVFKGVTVLHHGFAANSADLGTTGMKPATMMSVLDSGQINVRVEDAVTPASAVRIRTTAGVGEQLGAFRSAADSTDCAVLTRARFLTSADAGGIAVLEIDALGATLTEDA